MRLVRLCRKVKPAWLSGRFSPFRRPAIFFGLPLLTNRTVQPRGHGWDVLRAFLKNLASSESITASWELSASAGHLLWIPTAAPHTSSIQRCKPIAEKDWTHARILLRGLCRFALPDLCARGGLLGLHRGA